MAEVGDLEATKLTFLPIDLALFTSPKQQYDTGMEKCEVVKLNWDTEYHLINIKYAYIPKIHENTTYSVDILLPMY